QALADRGYDPLPGHFQQRHDDGGLSTPNGFAPAEALTLISGASHHFVSSSFASQQGLLDNAGPPSVEIHPDDAAVRRIQPGDAVELVNGRGVCRLRAVVTDAVRRGVVVAPKGRWANHSGGTRVNNLTSDALADFAGQSTFHSTRVWLRRAAGDSP